MPAFILSCSTIEDSEPVVADFDLILKSSSNESLANESLIDLFVFNDDGLMRLDSYQRITYNPEDRHLPYSASRRGPKKIVAIINPQTEKYEWNAINSFQAMLAAKGALEKEAKDKRLMCGTGHTYAGKDKTCKIEVTPLASEIVLNSIKCDFSSKPYKNAKLENVRVYLTNVNASASLLQSENFKPERLYNIAGCIDADIMEFRDPDLICQAIATPVGQQTLYPEIKLLCYPNESEEESPGSPFTRLVIEGLIDGKKCYYPISINRMESGYFSGKPGIGRNCRFTYDITIKSTGSSDPETEVSPGTMEIRCQTSSWNEMDKTEIKF